MQSEIKYEIITNNIQDSDTFNKRIDELVLLSLEFEDRHKDPTESYINEIKNNFLEKLKHNSVFVIVVDPEGDRTIAYGELDLQDQARELALLTEAYVSPEFRKRGIYTHLLRERERIAGEAGFRNIRALPVDRRSDSVLESQGYHEDYTIGDENIRIKSLSTYRSGTESE
ncbi:MAG TPA: GNAT family N-acetyltransferase [Candidatus Nitrosocosmicus sp.]|nr:GNAT family N-acetyltransferase [Candidatus Nitrosocosmicus sp.]